MERIHLIIHVFFSKNVLLAKHKKIILYFIFGCIAASVDLCIFFVFFNYFHINPVISTIVSISIATIIGFVLNAFINFKVEDRLIVRFLSYAFVSGIGMFLSSATLYIFYNIYGFDGNIVKILFLPVIFIVQYLFNNTISFRKFKRTDKK